MDATGAARTGLPSAPSKLMLVQFTANGIALFFVLLLMTAMGFAMLINRMERDDDDLP